MDPFLRLAGGLERVVMRVAVVCLALLAVSQGLRVDEATRRQWVFGDPLDRPVAGIPAVIAASAAPAELTVAVRVEGRSRAPGAVILVNGRRTADFSQQVAMVQVRPGDRLSIDARGYRESLRFRVIGVNPGISAPMRGQQVRTMAGMAFLGEVALQ